MLSKKQTGLEILEDICDVLDLVVEGILDKKYTDEEIFTTLANERYNDKIIVLFSNIIVEEILKIINNRTNSLYPNINYWREHQRDIQNVVLPLLQDYEKINYLGDTKAENFEKIDDFNSILQTRPIKKKDFIKYVEKIKYSYNWFEKYLNFTNQEEKQQFNSSILPFSLKYFSISNFQCIKHIEAQLPVDAQFIVFTGENGDGKTSILQALSLGFYNTKDLRDNEKGNTETAITVQYKANENSYHNEIYNNPKFTTLYSLRNNIRELQPFAAYGASRLQLESAESADNQKILRSPILNLFYSNRILQNIERWLRTRLLKGETEKYNNVIELLVKLLPNITAIEREDTADDVIFVYTEKGIKIPIEHLSSGSKSIVAMIGDMVIRLSSAQPEITNPKDFAGIVLIDELETHLHPKWQKEFPKILSETFPKVQFIVTTHSAITLLGMPKNTVFFKVTRTEEEGTQIERLEIDVENLLPNQILTSPLFDLDVLPAYNKNVSEIDTADTYQETQRRKDLDNKLKELANKMKTK